jgi:hypothetical protein
MGIVSAQYGHFFVRLAPQWAQAVIPPGVGFAQNGHGISTTASYTRVRGRSSEAGRKRYGNVVTVCCRSAAMSTRVHLSFHPGVLLPSIMRNKNRLDA